MARRTPLYPEYWNTLMHFFRRAAVLAVMSIAALCNARADVTGAGATFPSAVYESWAKQYEKQTGVKVNYQPTGSGDGIKKVSAREIQFGGTDIALTAAELAKSKLIQLPTLVGGIVPVINLEGIHSNELKLTGLVLAEIMVGNIAQWNDKRIADLNPGLLLPGKAIVRIVRADKSGSTEGLTKYLSLVSKSFEAQVGVSAQPKWPNEASLFSAQGNDGLVKTLASKPGSISYVSFDRVLKAGLTAVRLHRGNASNFVAASEEGFKQAVRSSRMQSEGADTASLLNLPNSYAWPITLTTFVLFDATPKRAADSAAALRFLYWTQLAGDRLVQDTGFAPLPLRVQAAFSAKFSKVVPQDGGAIQLQ